jgi:hypothetical protein
VLFEVLADDPVNAGAELVPAGVMVSDPPVVPTLPCAVVVPRSIKPSSASVSVNPVGQAPDNKSRIAPDGMLLPPLMAPGMFPFASLTTTELVLTQEYCPAPMDRRVCPGPHCDKTGIARTPSNNTTAIE